MSLEALPKINIVATRGKDDEKELYDLCGTKERRKLLDRQFKNNDSNFKVAVVCDMWITGFDVPSLAVMYIDKPLQKHTLVQTISRVNRVFEGKDKGLVVDYIGIKDNMMEALKRYARDDDEGARGRAGGLARHLPQPPRHARRAHGELRCLQVRLGRPCSSASRA